MTQYQKSRLSRRQELERLRASNAELVEALRWARPLAEIALEQHRLYRLRCGHYDIGAGTVHVGLYPSEIALRDRARAALSNATDQGG